MKRIPALALTLASLLLANITWAAIFTVDIAADDADAHDTNPGNGICADALGSCPLRAALEEANATAALDVILFANGFSDAVLTLAASEGPLPVITNQVFILGESIDAYNSAATLLRNAPPQFTIDGSQLTFSNQNGLFFNGTGAADSSVSALSIVNFPGTGIVVGFGADNVLIDRSYIGMRPDRSAAGNGGHGIQVISSDGSRIGKRRIGNAFQGLGNAVSSNGDSGIRLENSDDNQVHANLIGFSPSGTSNRGNGQYGIHITGNSNAIGDTVSDDEAGNFIGANDLGGLLIIGNNNLVHANELGRGETGGFITSEGDGIRVFGSFNFIGNNNGNGNKIYEHDGAAIKLGVIAGSQANDNFVIDNQIGSSGSLFPILMSGNGMGIDVANGDRNVIADNAVINSVTTGINIRGEANNLSGNIVGFVNGLFGSNPEPNRDGLMLLGADNIIGSAANPNFFGGNEREGIRISASGTRIEFNRIGVDRNLNPIGNGLQGLLVFGPGSIIRDNIIGSNGLNGLELHLADNSNIANNFIGIAPDGSNIGNSGHGINIVASTDNTDIVFNNIAFNTASGIGVVNNQNMTGLDWFQNLMHDNGGIGIDLGLNGITPNDLGDADEGANRLQNFPVIESAILDTLVTPPTLTISYRVDTDNNNADYPLTTHFYWSDIDENAQGRFYLGSDFSYNTPNAVEIITYDFVEGIFGGWLTATATDGAGNSSELAARLMFGELGEIFFMDGFEN